MASKRYTIFNLYIRGSNQAPQACHALKNLFCKKDTMTQEAQTVFNQWLVDEVEIMLQGGYHKDLESLYVELSKISNVPSAKFNESVEALNGTCTVVTFIANENIVAANDFIRSNRLTPANAYDELTKARLVGIESLLSLTDEEIFVASKVAFLPLAV